MNSTLRLRDRVSVRLVHPGLGSWSTPTPDCSRLGLWLHFELVREILDPGGRLHELAHLRLLRRRADVARDGHDTVVDGEIDVPVTEHLVVGDHLLQPVLYLAVEV